VVSPPGSRTYTSRGFPSRESSAGGSLKHHTGLHVRELPLLPRVLRRDPPRATRARTRLRAELHGVRDDALAHLRPCPTARFASADALLAGIRLRSPAIPLRNRDCGQLGRGGGFPPSAGVLLETTSREPLVFEGVRSTGSPDFRLCSVVASTDQSPLRGRAHRRGRGLRHDAE